MRLYIIPFVLLYMGGMLNAQGLTQDVQLPQPIISGGKPLMETLQLRRSERNFSEKPLDLQTLSNLLWAACGVNRAEEGKRTAPSARNKQEIDIYVALKEGLYRYNPFTNKLEFVLGEDIRKQTGMQPFVAIAPVNLIFVADLDKMGDGPENEKMLYAYADAGFIGQNVYLFCVSEGLANVVRGAIPREELAKAMRLSANKRIILAHTVGYPAK